MIGTANLTAARTPGRAPLPGAGAGGVGVILCAYTTRRWDALVEAVQSVAEQTRSADEVILVIDHNPELLARARETFTGTAVVANAGQRGLSGARNTGVSQAGSEIVAFLDDDARAQPNWLAELVAAYVDQRVVATGGVVEPRWEPGAAASWLPEEFYWTIGCSYRGLPTGPAQIRNPIGASMSFRRDAILIAGGFREGVGRLETQPLGCEETEMSVRVASAVPDALILHVPSARVDHLVEPERTRWRYFCSRCWSEGISKAVVTNHVGRSAALASERLYTRQTLPSGVLRGIRAGLRGEAAGFARATAIIAGLTITAAGYVYGWLRRSSGEVLPEGS